MPRYTVDPARFPGQLMPIPCRVVDAAGVEWRYVVGVDTDTGELLRYASVRPGQVIFTDATRTEIQTVREQAVARVSVLPIEADRAGLVLEAS